MIRLKHVKPKRQNAIKEPNNRPSAKHCRRRNSNFQAVGRNLYVENKTYPVKLNLVKNVPPPNGTHFHHRRDQNWE